MNENRFIKDGTHAKEMQNLNLLLSEISSSLNPQERALLAAELRRLSLYLQTDAYLEEFAGAAGLGEN